MNYSHSSKIGPTVTNLVTKDVMLSKRQQAVFNWLNDELDLPVYADAYKGALDFLNRTPPGYITFVSHVGRDFMNQLAETVRKMNSARMDNASRLSVQGIKPKRVNYVKRVNELQEAWDDKWGKDRRGEEESQSEPAQILEETADSEFAHLIPFETCERIQQLIDEHKAGNQRALKKGVLFFTTFLDYAAKEKIPKNLLDEWEAAREWFEKHNHLREGRFDQVKSCKVKKHFRMLDDSLYVAASTEIERLGEINEILEETNE